jgi:hypothetical protein
VPSYRCISCDINFPPAQKANLQGQCAKCGAVLTYYTNLASHRDWRRRSAGGVDIAPSEEEVEQWGPHPADDGCPVIYNNNTDTIHVQDKDLRAIGYLPESGDIVKLNGKYYELLGFSLRGKMWWLEPFYFEQTSGEISLAPLHVGPSSDDIVALDHDGKTIYWNPAKDPFRELMEDGDPEA